MKKILAQFLFGLIILIFSFTITFFFLAILVPVWWWSIIGAILYTWAIGYLVVGEPELDLGKWWHDRWR